MRDTLIHNRKRYSRALPYCCFIFCAVAAAFLLRPATAFSQTTNTSSPDVSEHHHVATTDDSIDGAKHPELVRDTTAYRLFFMVVGEQQEPTAERFNQQQAILAPIGLTDSERDVVISLLDVFKHDFMQQMIEYNATVEIANRNHIEPDVQGYKRERNALIERTRDALTASLSKVSLARFDAYIQGEKKHMKVGKEDQ